MAKLGMVTANTSHTLKSALSGKTTSFFVLAIWFFYLITSPFYVFPNGGPQPADLILILAMFPVLASLFIHLKTKKISTIYIVGVLFVLTTIGINLINYHFFPDRRFLLTSLIYPYNFLIFIFVTWLFQRDFEKAKIFTFYGILATIIIQFIVVYFTDFGRIGYRETGAFGNPNQFAYWVLLTAAMLLFLKRGEKLTPVDWGMLAVLLLLQSLALSKAGIIAHMIMMISIFFTKQVSKKTYLVILLALSLTMFYALFNPNNITYITDRIEPLKNVITRLQGIGTEADDSPEARGYYRIIEHPIYTLLGSGEGAFYRFNDEGYNRELHSGIATIIFSYGLLGSTLFTLFLGLIHYKQPWYYILLFAPMLLYGLTHQNFRFAHFWIFLGINYGVFLAKQRQQRREQEQKEQC